MKGKLFLLLLFWASGALGQGSHDAHLWFDHYVREAANNRITPQGDTVRAGFPANSDTLWTIRGLNKDTSRVYVTSSNLWLGMRWTDVAGDSVHLKIIWHMAPATQYAMNKIPAFGRFVKIDSVTVTRDGTQEMMKSVNLFSSSVPPWKYIYFTVEGLAQNKKAGQGTRGFMILSHWDGLPR